MRSLLAGVVFFSLGYPGWGLVFVVLALLGSRFFRALPNLHRHNLK
jgi:hypothetical protein